MVSIPTCHGFDSLTRSYILILMSVHFISNNKLNYSQILQWIIPVNTFKNKCNIITNSKRVHFRIWLTSGCKMHLQSFQTHSGYLLQTGLKRTVMVVFSYGPIRPCEGTQIKTGDWKSAELLFFVPSTRAASVLLRRSVPCTIRALQVWSGSAWPFTHSKPHS